jgi:hypothetical protein
MPVLLPVGFDKDGKTLMWMCSVCEAAFAPNRIMSNPPVSVLHIINDNFRIHCHREHKGQEATGLEIPKHKEDSSQAALRVVREATEDK